LIADPKRRIVITGAAGNLGRRLRIHWWERDDLDLVLLDCASRDDPAIVSADLSEWNSSWVDRFSGVDTIVHLAGNADANADSAALAGSNIDNARNLYRAAALHGVSRVIFASSVWAMAGRAHDRLPIFADDAQPGDNAYGASKRFAEHLAREQGIMGGPVTIALRIGGCPSGPNPPIRKNDWEDQCWLSNRDFCRGIDCALDAPVEGFALINLTSLVPDGRWDLEHTRAVIGYVPQDRFDPPPVPRSIGRFRRVMRKVRPTITASRRGPSDVQLVSAVGCELGEGPLWDSVRQCLWFLDIASGHLHRYYPDGNADAHIAFPGEPAFVVHDDAGGLLLGAGSTIHRFTDDALDLVTMINLPPGARVNDGCVDATGALWFGSMDRQGAEPAGRLYRYDGVEMTRHGRRCPIVNGPAFSPDGTTLYQADSVAGSIWQFAVRDGLLMGEGQPFVMIDPRHGAPDGLTVDAEGALWVALWGGWAVRRYAPDGRLLATVRFPCANVTKVAFGGPDLTTVYATSAAIGLSPHDRRSQPLAGALFRFDVPVPGLLPYRYRW
jgi:D-xylonolactonase